MNKRLKLLQGVIDSGLYKIPAGKIAGNMIDKALRSYISKYGWTSNGRKGIKERWRRPELSTKEGSKVPKIGWITLTQAAKCTHANKGYW